MKNNWKPSLLAAILLTGVLPLFLLHCGPQPSTEQTAEVTKDASEASTPDTRADEPNKQEPELPEKKPVVDEPVAVDQVVADEPVVTETPSEPTPEQPKGTPLSGVVRYFAVGGGGVEVDDATVCLSVPKGSCVKTDSKGAFTVPAVPDDTNVLLSAEKSTFMRTLYALAAGSAKSIKSHPIDLLPKVTATQISGAVGASLKPGTGVVLLHTSSQPGISATLSASGAEGPFFLTPQATPDQALKSTSTIGIAFFINVPLGTHTLTTSGTRGDICSHTTAWPGPKENEFLVKVEADSLTFVGVQCAAKVRFSGLTSNFATRKPLEGTKVCLVQPKVPGMACGTSNAQGLYTLPEFLEEKEMILTMEKTGFRKVLQMKGADQPASISASLVPSAMIPLLAGAVGAQVKPGTGVIVITTLNDSNAAATGLSMTISATGAQGPYFIDTNGQPDPTLTGTTAAAYAFFLNVPLGTHTVKTTGKSFHRCQAKHAWPTGNANEFRVKVEADAMSYFSVRCERRVYAFGNVSNFATQKPVVGAKLCLTQPNLPWLSCATSNAAGYFQLKEVPLRKDMLVSIEKAGFMKVLQSMGGDQVTHVNPVLVPTSMLPLLAGAVGVQLKPGTGIIVITTRDRRDQAASDISMQLSATGAEGPFFIGANGQPDKTLKGTTAGAFAFFVNVPPGDHTVTTVGLNKQTCIARRAWPGTNKEEFRVKVEADAMSYFTVQCDRERTRQLAEPCLQSDATKPEYNDCINDLICKSGVCATTLKRYSTCTPSTPCSDNHSCAVTKNPSKMYCFEHCDPDKQDCAADSFCMAYNNNIGRCLKKCTTNADCTDYTPSTCEVFGSVKICR